MCTEVFLNSNVAYFVEAKHGTQNEVLSDTSSTPTHFLIRWDYYNYEQMPKDKCMFCPSKVLDQSDGRTFCCECGAVQRPPTSAFKTSILTLSGRVIMLDDDGPHLVPRGTCRYCRNKISMEGLAKMICSHCQQSQKFQKLLPADQVIFELPDGKLVKLDVDFERRSNENNIPSGVDNNSPTIFFNIL